jgi:tetratricopeptide (TPR) repeat protein
MFSSKAPANVPKHYKKGQKKKSIKAMFQDAKKLERQGKWNEASELYVKILENEPKDAHSHLALARLEAKRENKKSDMCADVLTRAQHAFKEGTLQCPDSVHLWQAWAVYEDSRGHIERARELYEEALKLDPQNPYVCHAFGLYYKKLGMIEKAMDLFGVALASQSTAALVCSLGELLVGQDKLEDTRLLYSEHLPKLATEKDRIEVYLAAAWLEERCFKDVERAMTLLNMALKLSPDNSLANVAMARLEGRINQKTGNHNSATAKRLADACREIEDRKQRPSDPTDGRVFNALAQIEVRAKQFCNAREVLKRGIHMYPLDHNVRVTIFYDLLRCRWTSLTSSFFRVFCNSCFRQLAKSKRGLGTSQQLDACTARVCS